VIDGLLTGLHEPRASHLRMLTAIAGEQALRAAYAEALRGRYLWHEFGDVHLLLAEARPGDLPPEAVRRTNEPEAVRRTDEPEAVRRTDEPAGAHSRHGAHDRRSGAHDRRDGDAGGSQGRDETAENAGHETRDDAGHPGLPGELHVMEEGL
jgi:S-adenosylmethionine:tRNA ribosyltransferase-isomerase